MLIAPSEILTSNGRLRHMVKGDLSAFSEMNADLRVMEFFPRPWSLEESHAAFERIEIGFAERGFGIYALEFKEEFAGIIGLSVPIFEAYFTPCVEILWRLLPRFWGKGLVSEAGAAVLQMAFQTLRMPEIVAFAASKNLRSIHVMERLGMKRDRQEYFEHPAVTDVHLQQHVLYRATQRLSIAE
ncbi:GNAT family N-acetyltransferase [Edaphobacter aggregans]|uniref:GNAT family N-acetyltransferase n=1 Tax=Edaphobacter aggregans TaxID=570835 RepID=UPI000558EC22|nr:GNAT family N-acetyltransferase [Edaphobacter aggregans]